MIDIPPIPAMWLLRLAQTYFQSGSELADQISAPDNVAIAEKYLERFEKSGWIERGKNKDMSNPKTRNIHFFGVGGATGKRSESPLLYGFSPTKILTIVYEECWRGIKK